MSQPQPPQRGFIYWRDLALHTLPVATVLGFLAVIVFLNSVFGIWGLSVAQLVTPGDTIVPGVILGILLVALFMFAFIPGTLLDPILKKMPMRIRPYALAGVVAASAVFWIPNGVGGFGVKFVATLIALGCAMHPFLNRHDFEKIPHMAKAATRHDQRRDVQQDRGRDARAPSASLAGPTSAPNFGGAGRRRGLQIKRHLALPVTGATRRRARRPP